MESNLNLIWGVLNKVLCQVWCESFTSDEMPWNKSRWTFHGFVVSEAKMMLEMHYSPPMSRLALICLTNKKLWQRLVSDADVSVAALLFSQLWIGTGRGEDPNMQTEMCRDQTSPRARARDRYFVKTNDRIKMKTVSRDILCWFTSLLAPHQLYFWHWHHKEGSRRKNSGQAYSNDLQVPDWDI